MLFPTCVADWTLCGPTMESTCDGTSIHTPKTSNKRQHSTIATSVESDDNVVAPERCNDDTVSNADLLPPTQDDIIGLVATAPEERNDQVQNERQPENEDDLNEQQAINAYDDSDMNEQQLINAYPSSDRKQDTTLPPPVECPLSRPPQLTREDRTRTGTTTVTMTTAATAASDDGSNSTYAFLDYFMPAVISQETMHHHMNSGIPINVYDDQQIINLAAAYANGTTDDIRDDRGDTRGGQGLPSIIAIPSQVHQHTQPRPHHKRSSSLQQQAAIFATRPPVFPPAAARGEEHREEDPCRNIPPQVVSPHPIDDDDSMSRAVTPIADLVDVSMGMDDDNVPYVECHKLSPPVLQATLHSEIRLAREQASLLDLPKPPTYNEEPPPLQTNLVIHPHPSLALPRPPSFVAKK